MALSLPYLLYRNLKNCLRQHTHTHTLIEREREREGEREPKHQDFSDSISYGEDFTVLFIWRSHMFDT